MGLSQKTLTAYEMLIVFIDNLICTIFKMIYFSCFYGLSRLMKIFGQF